MENTEQNPEHHPEGDVFTHSMLAVEMAGELKEHSKNPLAFMYAALCHDVGKVNSTQVQADGKITAYGHAEVGEKMIAETLKNITKLFNEHFNEKATTASVNSRRNNMKKGIVTTKASNKNLWTQEDDNFVRTHYKTLTDGEIGKKLGRSNQAVGKRALHLGLREKRVWG